MRLIDVDDFLEKMKRTSRYFDVKFDIEDMQTIDAVPVIRCRECKYFNVWGDGCKTCYFWTDQHDMPTDEDAFCSYGERKEGDGNG